VTENGGPQDIVENCRSGLIVDVNDQAALTNAMLRLLTDRTFWDECSRNGVNLVRQHYTWETHCGNYLDCLKEVIVAPVKTPSAAGRSSPAKRIDSLDSLLITDIDNTLLGDDEALQRLKAIIHEHRGHTGFGVASGRALELVQEALEANGIDEIDVIIASVGSEIYVGNDLLPEKGWASRLRRRWRPDRIREALQELPFLHMQDEPHTQREFKISYDLDDKVSEEEALRLVHETLAAARVAYSLIFSHGTFVDILPHRASKGKAVRYLADKWNVSLERVVTAGDSGNDIDMLIGQTGGIVVGNYDPELEYLRQSRAHRIYFAKAHCAGGIIEGLRHYGIIGPAAGDGDGAEHPVSSAAFES
jgi:sucrose-phosphate synthase